MANKYILAINPGSTSTKVAVFLGEEKVFSKNISHPAEDLAGFRRITDQYDFRKRAILQFLKDNAFDITLLAAVVGRGGLLTPMSSGTYNVGDDMMHYLQQTPLEHASNLGALLARAVADPLGLPAYIVDPVVVDEMEEIAKITGVPEIRRISIFHALNQKAVAREAAARIGKKYDESNLIVAHLGGGISIGAHRCGQVVDVNNALNGDGPFAPERAGSLPAWSLVEWALSGKYDTATMKKKLTGQGGIVAHLGINDMRQVEERVKQGDARAALVYQAMAYNVAKWIGAMAAVLAGRVDAVVLTGGIAYDADFVEWIRARVSFIAPLIVIPGEDEMSALAKGALRVLNGEEQAKQWQNTQEE